MRGRGNMGQGNVGQGSYGQSLVREYRERGQAAVWGGKGGSGDGAVPLLGEKGVSSPQSQKGVPFTTALPTAHSPVLRAQTCLQEDNLTGARTPSRLVAPAFHPTVTAGCPVTQSVVGLPCALHPGL